MAAKFWAEGERKPRFGDKKRAILNAIATGNDAVMPIIRKTGLKRNVVLRNLTALHDTGYINCVFPRKRPERRVTTHGPILPITLTGKGRDAINQNI